jgi:hypothetical protein
MDRCIVEMALCVKEKTEKMSTTYGIFRSYCGEEVAEGYKGQGDSIFWR